ncbi:MAG: hypothetical protein Q4F84_09255 [Fibrobacter sp.]|nr:hypothetical protein [Fibrobacter sp.]
MKIKLGLVACAFALGIGFSGCGLTDEKSEAPEIKLESKDAWTFAAGSTYEITGEIKASEQIIDVQIDVVNENDRVVDESEIKVNYPPNMTGTKSFEFKNSNFTITVAPNAQSGTYKIEVWVTTESEAEGSLRKTITVTGGSDKPTGTPVTISTITAGANKNSQYGSSIDLDAGVAYKMADAASRVADIDLCYAFAGTTNDEKIGSPYWAKASEFDFAKNWTNPLATKFYKLSMTAAEFDAITTKEQMPAFTEASATEASYAVTSGDVFIVKTSQGATALIRIADKVAGAAGTITIKSAK